MFCHKMSKQRKEVDAGGMMMVGRTPGVEVRMAAASCEHMRRPGTMFTFLKRTFHHGNGISKKCIHHRITF